VALSVRGSSSSSSSSSTSTSTSTSAARTPPLPQPRPDEVLYFAYGSNMSPSVLTGRRKVRPRASAPCELRDWSLCFNMLGLPYAEPGFASIEPFTGKR
jgi:hypothetical protein